MAKTSRNGGVSRHSKVVDFSVGENGPWRLIIPQTVYPPREDTKLLAEALYSLDMIPSLAVEIGCGSGALSIILAELGWEVMAYDINPYAVASSRSNVEEHGLAKMVTVLEGGVGEPNWSIPENAKLLVWNLPYLEPLEGPLILEPIEEASMVDIPDGGWSSKLMSEAEEHEMGEFVVILLMRIDPESPSKREDWLANGWSCREILSLRIGDEKIGAFAFWKPGFGIGAVTIDECESTMDEASKVVESGWQRIRTDSQLLGRGRRGSTWESRPGDLIATWRVPVNPGLEVNHGLIQTAVGSVISKGIGCRVKWPNDLIDGSGEKLGGIVSETSSNEDGMRVGVGINSEPRDVGGKIAPGWSETLGKADIDTVFGIVDASISGILEDIPGLPIPSGKELLEISWRGLSASLSEGASPSTASGMRRVVGLDNNGGLIIEADGEVSVVTDVDELEWFFP